MWLLIPAIVLLLFSSLGASYYTYHLERGRYKHQPIILICGVFVLFLVGTIMLFIATGWKWGLAGLGISWLVLVLSSLGYWWKNHLILFISRLTPFQKWFAYHAEEYLDPLAIRHIKEIGDVWDQHIAELEDFWRLTSPDECASLVVDFLEELRHKWPREFSELNPAGLPDAISEDLRNSIILAYKVGYMRGKGWISNERRNDFGIFLGDKLARDIRSVLKGAKSKGIAFACGFTAVTVRGHLKVLQLILGGKSASQG